jgi:hypothetical protein
MTIQTSIKAAVTAILNAAIPSYAFQDLAAGHIVNRDGVTMVSPRQPRQVFVGYGATLIANRASKLRGAKVTPLRYDGFYWG